MYVCVGGEVTGVRNRCTIPICFKKEVSLVAECYNELVIKLLLLNPFKIPTNHLQVIKSVFSSYLFNEATFRRWKIASAIYPTCRPYLFPIENQAVDRFGDGPDFARPSPNWRRLARFFNCFCFTKAQLVLKNTLEKRIFRLGRIFYTVLLRWNRKQSNISCIVIV